MKDTAYTISKNNKVLCVTDTPYDRETVRAMKNAGYTIKKSTTQTKENESWNIKPSSTILYYLKLYY